MVQLIYLIRRMFLFKLFSRYKKMNIWRIYKELIIFRIGRMNPPSDDSSIIWLQPIISCSSIPFRTVDSLWCRQMVRIKPPNFYYRSRKPLSTLIRIYKSAINRWKLTFIYEPILWWAHTPPDSGAFSELFRRSWFLRLSMSIAKIEFPRSETAKKK